MNDDDTLRDLIDKMYIPRVVDSGIDTMLSAFGGVLVTGPKWCGKSWTGVHHASSSIMLGTDRANKLARLSPEDALAGRYPRLIDEWQDVPDLWDIARRRIDFENKKGMYIFTGSTVPPKTHHSGTGRFARMSMKTMSLYESGNSNGSVSLSKLFSEGKVSTTRSRMDYKKIVRLICKGGWPSTSKDPNDVAVRISEEYVKSIIQTDLSAITGTRKNPVLTERVLRSLARNSASPVKISTLTSDISEEGRPVSDQTIRSYVDSLKDIFMVEEQHIWSPHLRSRTRLRSSPKIHFTDPSLATAVLGITSEALEKDVNTAGLLFESLCYRDISVYASSLYGNLYYYRDSNGLEIDNIIELPDGRWGAMEVKLGDYEVDKAAKNLLRLNGNVKNDASFLSVITATGKIAYTREDGVSVIPIDLLGP